MKEVEEEFDAEQEASMYEEQEEIVAAIKIQVRFLGLLVAWSHRAKLQALICIHIIYRTIK